MKKLSTLILSACLSFAVSSAFAQDAMKKDGMMKKTK